MATINKEIAHLMISQNGYFDLTDKDAPDNQQASKILTYNNMFGGGLSYAVVFPHENQMRYEHSPACTNVQILWESKTNV